MEFWTVKTIAGIGVLALSLDTLAYDSGSTGADGAFAPTVDTELTLPANGIFNFTDVTIPAGVTVTFARNISNTPVFMLANGGITIDGIIDVSGGDVPAAPGPSPSLADDLSSEGGPGGFDGGDGGSFNTPGINGENGRGPGGGNRGVDGCGGSSGGYGVAGIRPNLVCSASIAALPGQSYGDPELSLLVGGSGGAGGSSDNASGFLGQGGAGGGGAILLGATNQITVNGAVIANGGNVADQAFARGAGGAGSGGSIRLVADAIGGEGQILALGGIASTAINSAQRSGDGGVGRIKLETNFMQRVAGTNPPHVFSPPRRALFSQLPLLRISSFGGVPAPAILTGDSDIVLPGIVNNPVTVGLVTNNVPLGSIIKLTVSPNGVDKFNVNSNAVIGTFAAGTATVDVTMPSGASSLQATTTFTVVASVGDALSRYAMGERVQSVSLLASVVGNVTEFTTVSGKTFRYPSDQVAVNGGQG